jgi:TRAP-type C4-dicarboxylate transport system permease small subunit
MLKWIQKIDNGLEKLERALAVGLFCFLMGLICVNIFTRNVLHWVSHQLIELTPTVVLWLALVGASMALKHHSHIKIELLLRFISLAGRRIAVGLTSLFSMGICGLLAIAAVPFVRNEIVIFGAQGWVAICFPLFFATAFFRFCLHFLSVWGAVKGERP